MRKQQEPEPITEEAIDPKPPVIYSGRFESKKKN